MGSNSDFNSNLNLSYERLSNIFNFFIQTFVESYAQRNAQNGIMICIPESTEQDVLKRVMRHYIDHTKTYGVVVGNVCPFKILAWAGYMLADDLYSDDRDSQTLSIECISSAIVCMIRILKEEGTTIEESFHKKALHMALYEIMGNKRKTPDSQAYRSLGLGMNGLYMMFRTASVCKKKTSH